MVRCIDPAGAASPVEAVGLENMTRLRSQPAWLPGVHRFVDESEKTVASFAVNLDSQEGDLHAASPEFESRLFGGQVVRLEPGTRVTRELLEGRFGRELWRPLLVLVLVLLAVESLIGRGRTLT